MSAHLCSFGNILFAHIVLLPPPGAAAARNKDQNVCRKGRKYSHLKKMRHIRVLSDVNYYSNRLVPFPGKRHVGLSIKIFLLFFVVHPTKKRHLLDTTEFSVSPHGKVAKIRKRTVEVVSSHVTFPCTL
jgi:hypothetical protein